MSASELASSHSPGLVAPEKRLRPAVAGIPWLAPWLIVSAGCVVAGWGLSALGQLNLPGYLVFALAACLLWAGMCQQRGNALCSWPAFRGPLSRWRRRWKRPLPLLFLVLAALALAGGVLYPPNNYDALSYRLPRMLHWLAEGRWHWIVTANDRMNYSAPDFEWISLPLFLLAKSGRFIFLINISAYLFLPGLVFAVGRRLGLSGRAAWHWMWLLPSAHCFAMQAGSIGNDAVGAIYVLAAVYYGLRAKETGQIQCLWLAGLAAALLTGLKTSNLPLLLPVLLALWPARGLLKQRLLASGAVVGLCAVISVLPTAALNAHYSGDWAGDPGNKSGLRPKDLFSAFAGNSLSIAVQNATPPVFPGARKLKLAERLPASLVQRIKQGFPRFDVTMSELPQEENVGLGLALLGLVLATGLAVLRQGCWSAELSPANRRGLLIGGAAWIALMVFMTKIGSETSARLLTAYYPLLILPFLAWPAANRLVRRRWWTLCALLCSLSLLPGLLLTPSRPLLPMGAILDHLAQQHPQNEQLARARQVYANYARRHDVLGPLRNHIPSEIRELGLICGETDTEMALWRPFGQRRVRHLVGDARLRPNLEWVVVKQPLADEFAPSFEAWLAQTHGRLVATERITATFYAGEVPWCVVQFPAAKLSAQTQHPLPLFTGSVFTAKAAAVNKPQRANSYE